MVQGLILDRNSNWSRVATNELSKLATEKYKYLVSNMRNLYHLGLVSELGCYILELHYAKESTMNFSNYCYYYYSSNNEYFSHSISSGTDIQNYSKLNSNS